MSYIIAMAIVAALFIATFAFAATRPKSFHVERSIQIKASPEKIFSLISHFQRWDDWSPWEALDPEKKKQRSGAASGLGAIYEWQGNNEVGQGRMEIATVIPHSSITIQLDIVRPIKLHSTIEFKLQAKGNETEVSWAVYGPNPTMSGLMSLFFNMERMAGSLFNDGLSNLKEIAEGRTLVRESGSDTETT